MPPIKAILFDVFGTVVDWRGSLITDLSSWGARSGLSVDWPGLVDAWRGAYLPSMNQVRQGALPWMNLDALHARSLAEIGPAFGLPANLSDADHAYIVQAWHRLDPWPDAVAGLTRLRAYTTIGTLSNGNVALLVTMAKRAGLPWDMVFSAELFRHYKPDAEIYLGACALLNLAPASVMLAAAHNMDLAAARELGMRTAFIARPTEYGPAQKRDLSANDNWEFIADGIGALADMMERSPLKD